MILPDLNAVPMPIRDVCQLTCACGELIADAWGPTSNWGDVRRAECPACQKVWYFRPDHRRRVPYQVFINPADPSQAVARWDD